LALAVGAVKKTAREKLQKEFKRYFDNNVKGLLALQAKMETLELLELTKMKIEKWQQKYHAEKYKDPKKK